jgi:UDP-MurNAc hydroxylase
MEHLKKIKVNSTLDIACYSSRHIDSVLAIFINKVFWCLNINDTELNNGDISIIKKNWGNPTILLNQFSIAGYAGIESELLSKSTLVIEKMLSNHIALDAKVTIPFASFIRFARSDNNFMNQYANSPIKVKEYFEKLGYPLGLFSYNSDELIWKNLKTEHYNKKIVDQQSITEFSDIYGKFSYDTLTDEFIYKTIIVDEVKKAIEDRLIEWKSKTNKLLWKQLSTIKICIPDWKNEVWCVNFQSLSFTRLNEESIYDIKILSQPLLYSFSLPFGIQTLGISCRYSFNLIYKDVPKTWRLIRIISSLYNAEIYLSFKSLISLKLYKWIWMRRKGLASQIVHQVNRFI